MSQESILVVDDEEVMRDVLGSLLTQAGYEVSLVSNGADGLELARRGTYAAALVDMMLPEMDGMTVLEELRKADPELVVLMITAHASVETAIAAFSERGLCLDLGGPLNVAGTAVADAGGIARVGWLVPPDYSFPEVSLQAVAVRGPDFRGSLKSDAVTAPVTF